MKGVEVNGRRFETPGTLAIMLIYLALFLVMWLLSYAYLATKWIVG